MGGDMRGWRTAAIACALVVSSAVPVASQGVERIMRARETLALTADQISQLDAIRREVVAQRSAERAEIEELRSQLSAGQIRQSQLMAAQEARMDAAQGRAEALGARVDAILTEEQRASVELMRGRADGLRGRRPAGRPGRGFAPGGRGGIGGGFGPGGLRGRRGGGGTGL
jgi:hypothetical protein